MSTLSENAFCKKFGSDLKPARVRKWRREHGFGKGKTKQRGRSLDLTKDDGYKILLRWEIRKHGGTMLDAWEQPDRINFNRVGKDYKYLYRHNKRIKGAEHLKMGGWILSRKEPTMDKDDLSLMTINLVAVKETVDGIFS
jgi:hypothetical protein